MKSAVRCAGEHSQSCTVVLMKSAVRCAGEQSVMYCCAVDKCCEVCW